MLFSVAYADSPEEFIERWNRAAHIYGAPELGDYAKADDTYIFTGDDWFVSVTYQYGVLFDKVQLFSESPERYLALCAMTGVAVLEYKTIDMLNKYDASILTNYLKMVSDQSPEKALFYSDYKYQFVKMENGFAFSMGE